MAQGEGVAIVAEWRGKQSSARSGSPHLEGRDMGTFFYTARNTMVQGRVNLACFTFTVACMLAGQEVRGQTLVRTFPLLAHFFSPSPSLAADEPHEKNFQNPLFILFICSSWNRFSSASSSSSHF